MHRSHTDDKRMDTSPSFSIRNVICEHTQEARAPFLKLDERRRRRGKLPVFHIFGATETGQKACLHIHGVLPYIVVRVGSEVTPKIESAIIAKMNKLIQEELGNPEQEGQTADFVIKTEVFKSRSLYGYYEKDEDFMRIFFASPFYTNKVTRGLAKEVNSKRLFQPFEAHYPFHLQFFMDHSLFGMDLIHMKKVRIRIPAEVKDDDIAPNGWTYGQIKNSPLYSPLEKTTECPLECDGLAEDIMNAFLQKDNVHSTNPGLDYLWREEAALCAKAGIQMKDVFRSYEPRPSHTSIQERKQLKTAKDIARDLWKSHRQQADETIVFSNTQSDVLSQTMWETPEEEVEVAGEQEDDVDKAKSADEDDDELALEMTMMIPEKQNESMEEIEDPVEDHDSATEENRLEQSESKRAVNDGKWHWVTTKSSQNQSFGVRGDEKPTGRPKPTRVMRSLTREMTCDSQLSDVASYLHLGAETMEATTSRIEKTTMVEAPDELGSDVIGVCAASMELLAATSLPYPCPTTDEIIAVSIAVMNDVCRSQVPSVKVILTTVPLLNTGVSDNVVNVGSEIDLILELISMVKRSDVDVLVGYDCERLSWGYLTARITFLNLPLTLSRYKQTDVEYPSSGRITVSVWRSVRSDLTLRSYDIGTATAQVLKKRIPMIDQPTMTGRIRTGEVREVLSYLETLTRLNISLLVEMNWFVKNAEMARVYGIQFQEVWTRGSQLRVESMLLRLARKSNYVAPSVTPNQRNRMSAPEQLQLILEPQSKVYFDPVIVLDFQSLYPSMIIAYNYCFSTVFGKLKSMTDLKTSQTMKLGALAYDMPVRSMAESVANKQVTVSPLNSLFVNKAKRKGLVPTMLDEILATRFMVKEAMKRTKNKKRRMVLDARQLALKLVANVTYGYTAANFSGRMPCAEIADAILGKGRETLESAIRIVTSGRFGACEVIYGDTDSMFVRTPGATLEKAFEIGRAIAEAVTNSNPDPVVLKLEKVYMGCVLETKKRYAGWMYEHPEDTPKLDSKGIETIRRDTAPIVSRVLSKSLELIFTKKWRTFAAYLNQIAVDIQRQPYGDFVFCREYRDGYAPTAMVPQRKIAEQRSAICATNAPLRGERISYLIVEGPPTSTVYSCVVSLPNFIANPNLRINATYYLKSHILAALRRVTDLLPTEIQLLPLHSNQCYTPNCTRIGQTPWCTVCVTSPSTLAATLSEYGEVSRSQWRLQQNCKSCRRSTHMLSESEITHCTNHSCDVLKSWNALIRNQTRKVIADHRLY